MITLYKQTTEIKDIQGNVTGYDTQAVLFPNTFFLYSGLKFDWDANTVEYRGSVYYLDKLTVVVDESIPLINDWLSTYGNSIEFNYYNGTINEFDKNPSGNLMNVSKILYKSQTSVKYIIEHTYDALNRCTKRESIAPKGSNAVTEEYTKIDDEIAKNNIEQNLKDLKIIPYYNFIVNDEDNKVEIFKDTDREFLFVSHNNSADSYVDGIEVKADDNAKVAVIDIKIDNPEWQINYVIATKTNGEVVKEYSEKTNELRVENNDKLIEYVVIFIINVKGLKGKSIQEITQNNLKLTVDMIPFINLNYYSGDTVLNTVEYPKDTTVQLENLQDEEDKVFVGWFSSDAADNDTPLTEIKLVTNTNIYARYEQLYVVTLKNIDGREIGNDSILKFKLNDTITDDLLKSYIDESEYEFEGFYEDEEFSTTLNLPITITEDYYNKDIYCKFNI